MGIPTIEFVGIIVGIIAGVIGVLALMFGVLYRVKHWYKCRVIKHLRKADAELAQAQPRLEEAQADLKTLKDTNWELHGRVDDAQTVSEEALRRIQRLKETTEAEMVTMKKEIQNSHHLLAEAIRKEHKKERPISPRKRKSGVAKQATFTFDSPEEPPHLTSPLEESNLIRKLVAIKPLKDEFRKIKKTSSKHRMEYQPIDFAKIFRERGWESKYHRKDHRRKLRQLWYNYLEEWSGAPSTVGEIPNPEKLFSLKDRTKFIKYIRELSQHEYLYFLYDVGYKHTREYHWMMSLTDLEYADFLVNLNTKMLHNYNYDKPYCMQLGGKGDSVDGSDNSTGSVSLSLRTRPLSRYKSLEDIEVSII